MSIWFGILKGVLAVAGAIARYMGEKQLLDAGQALAISNNLFRNK